MLSPKKSLSILKKTNALLEGHFVLSSGLHSSKYIQCAKLLSFPHIANKICQSLSKKIKKNFKKIDVENYIFDLRGYINKEISDLNIKNIENIEKDTFSEKNFFYSYRRSCLNKEQDYGRCISVILMT